MRNKMKKILIVGLLALLAWVGHAQVITIHIDQPAQIMAFAGTDTLICKNHSIILGSEETATGGTPDYIFSWYPDLYLDNPNIANPTCTPDESITYMLTVADYNGCTATSYVSVGVDPCLGVTLDYSSSKITIYPNPATDHFIIQGLPLEANELEIRMVNQIGQTMIQQFVSNPSTNTDIRIDSKNVLPPGLYILHLRISDRVITKSIQIL